MELTAKVYSEAKRVMLEKRTKVTFISGILFGITAHGAAIFNKFSYHDDAAALFGLGLTIESGRWMLDLLGRIKYYLLYAGTALYSTPAFNAIFSIIFIAAAACVVVHLLDIKKSVLCCALGGFMVCFPVVTGLLAFMFTAPDYMLGLFFMVTGVYLVCRKENIPCFIAGIILQSCGIGVYQAWIPVGLGLYTVRFFKEIYEKDFGGGSVKDRWLWFFKKAIKYVSAVVLSLLVYYLILRIWLLVTHKALVTTAGLNEMGAMSFGAFLDRLKKAYLAFFFPERTIANSLYTFNLKYFYRVMLLILSASGIMLILKVMREDKAKALQMLIPLCVLPLAADFIFIMVEFEYIHSNLYYGQVTIFIFAVFAVQSAGELKKAGRYLCSLSAVFMIMFTLFFAKFDNICYMKTTFAQSQAVSYFTTLVSRIKNTEGYTDSLNIAFVNPVGSHDDSICVLQQLEPVTLLSYGNVREYLTDYAKEEFIKNWVGFKVQFKDPSEFENLPEVQEMPFYPDSGSVKIIGDTVVVKF